MSIGPPSPQVSPDGRFYWDGQRWVAIPTPIEERPPPPVSYGGFWIRFVAFIIDAIIVAAVIAVVGGTIGAATYVALYGVTGEGGGIGNSNITTSPAATALFWFFALAVALSYFVYFWSTGGTLGMKLFGLRVVDAKAEKPPGIGRAIIRYVVLVISATLCFFGLVWAAFDVRKQGWHDKAAGTVVIRLRAVT